jgi:hypothetical protein
MRKKPEYGLGRNVVANKPSARRPLAAWFFMYLVEANQFMKLLKFGGSRSG